MVFPKQVNVLYEDEGMQFKYFIFPIILIISGTILHNTLHVNINSFYGFRTKTSSRNKQSWEYCNKLCADILIAVGVISVVAACITANITTKYFGIFFMGELINVLAVCLVLLSIPIINKKCRRKFPD